MLNSKPNALKLTSEQEREIIDAANDILATTGFGELSVEFKKGEVDVIKAIYRKPKKSQATSHDA